MDMLNQERAISLPLTDQAPSSARHWFSAGSKVSGDIHDRVVLLLSELVANSVSHSGLKAPDEVEVSVRRIPGGLHVEVVDHGVGIDDPPRMEGNHFGLRFVDTETDRWGFTNDPTRVWFEIIGERA
jgi:anti-sigma regulatory factor (Ser/Thr protein kinase)